MKKNESMVIKPGKGEINKYQGDSPGLLIHKTNDPQKIIPEFPLFIPFFPAPVFFPYYTGK
jgi:hypothetical protein